jgi:hypothetical protein
MLFYKAWLESRVRFAFAAIGVIAYCFFFLIWARTHFPLPEYPGLPYSGLVWGEIYGNSGPLVFTAIALLLGLGGLPRERAGRSAGFTLGLPIARRHLIATRATVGVSQLVLLALIPAFVLPTFSPSLAGQTYSFVPPLQFAVLYLSWGVVWFSLSVFWSTVFASDYTAAIVALLTPFIWMGAIVSASNLSSGVGRMPPMIPSMVPPRFMSGEALIKPNFGVIVHPMPWLSIAFLLAVAAAIVIAATSVLDRQSY